MMRLNRVSNMTACLVSLLSPSMALAQQGPGASMTEASCSMPPPLGSPGALDAILKPGASVPVPPSDPQAAQVLQQRIQEAFFRDFAARCRFKVDNAQVANKTRVVFMGDSITEFWFLGDPSLFASGVVDRGISGQTTPQMLLRFYQDVIALHPKVVHIMAGTNNLAGNTGPNSPEDFKNDIRAMVDLALAHGIKVVLASIPPADHFGWRPDLRPAEQIRMLNNWLRSFALERKLTYVDYYRVMASPSGGMKAELSNDGVHPNANGYAVMRPLVDAAIAK